MQINVNGLNINYEVEGEGKPVILLHGWLANLETMRPIANCLKDKFKTYNIDVVGFGESDLPKEPLKTEGFGDFLKDLIEKLEIKNPILIGHSNGGKTIINAVGRGVVEPNKIVLIDSTGVKPKKTIKKMVKIYTFKLCKNILKIFPENEKYNQIRENLLGKFASSDYKDAPEVLRKTMSQILNEDQTHLMEFINVPTLLVWGENDTATPIKDAEIMEKLIPDAGLIKYKNSGHFSYLENIHDFNIVINEFLKDDAIAK